MGKKVLVVGIFVLFLVIPTGVLATNQPYEGARFTCAKSITNNVLFECSFPYTNGNNFDDGNWIGGVINVAGRDGTNPSGYIYQIGFSLGSDDLVSFCPIYSLRDSEKGSLDTQPTDF